MRTIQPVDDPSAYPRVYRASGGWLIALVLCGSMFAIAGIVGVLFAATKPHRDPSAQFVVVGLCVASGIFGIYCLLSTFRSRVVLFADRIEVEELTSTKVLSREEVRGWRSLDTSPPGFVLSSTDSARRPVKVAQVFGLDSAFEQWLYTLPCLDGEDFRASKAEIRNNVQLGATPGERMKTLAKGIRLAKVLAVVTTLAALWGWIYPRPYELAIVVLVALPWVAVEIVRRSHGLFRLDTNRNDAHPNVGLALILPGLVLLLRSTLDYNVLQSTRLGLFTIGMGALLGLSGWLVDAPQRARRTAAAVLLIISLPYGYGGAIEANALLDRSPVTSYMARVEGKRIVKGKTTSYQVELGPWGPRAKTNKLQVSRATYNLIERGDTVYLTLRQGALGVKWYFMRAWERGDQTGGERTAPLRQ